MKGSNRITFKKLSSFKSKLKKKHLYTTPAYNTRMSINQIIMGLGLILGVYIMYKLFFNKIKVDDNYKKVYDKVLTSKEYKVKGQYDK